MFENPRRGRLARNFATNVPKILDLNSSSEQIFSENWSWVPLKSKQLETPRASSYLISYSGNQIWRSPLLFFPQTNCYYLEFFFTLHSRLQAWNARTGIQRVQSLPSGDSVLQTQDGWRKIAKRAVDPSVVTKSLLDPWVSFCTYT